MLEDIKKIPNLKEFKRVPITKEIYADFITPIEALKVLKKKYQRVFLFESVEQRQHWGRWSFLGFNPKLEITAKKGVLSVKKGDKQIHIKSNPIEFLRKVLDDNKAPKLPDLPAFCGGLVGYFAYDFIRYFEKKLDFKDGLEDFKDLDLMLFNDIIAFDHLRQKIILITNVNVENLSKSYKKSLKRLESMQKILTSSKKGNFTPLKLESKLEPLIKESAFVKKVQTIKDYIFKGDIFQAVLSTPFFAKASGNLFDTYRILRTSNPSPYMFYLFSPKLEIAGSSPETLVRVNSNEVFTFPIAGTRPLGANLKENEKIAQELLKDEKELSEHNMLVDLSRNDLGKISEFGSVKVKDYLKIQFYAHVMHITSSVCGLLQKGRDSLDAICAILPAGTLSGAPKIRACEIINELECRSRGIYGGGIGYLGFNGDMDLCIAIRFAYKKGEKVCVQAGAGIVSDSISKKEYEEILNKSKALRVALEQANGGLKEGL